MAFWDFLKKLFGEVKPPDSQVKAAPETPLPAPGSIPLATPQAATSAPTPKAQAAKVVAPLAPPPPNPSDFLPIQRDDLLKQAEDVRRNTGWMWFGRRDIIPPISDPRTKLIDRGMLTQGLLSADQLAQMHAVGEEHDKYANREHHINVKAGQSAEEAVEADRAARAELKVRKKAEAAQRKQNRATEVAVRKAADIIFVGKGVSALLGERMSDVEKLTAAGLPILHAPADLSAALGLTIGKLRWLCFHTDVATRIHYVQFEIAKRSGGVRVLSAPHRTLGAAQRWVLENILDKLPTEQAAHGFVRGRSILTNAKPHVGQGVLINLDLEAFFPSIGFARVRHLFKRAGYSGAVATLLALICTECPRKKVTYDGTIYFVATGKRGLPQGACTSPAISNQIARKLDRRLTGISMKLGVLYTRYADDLTFSASKEFGGKIGYLLARVRHIAQEEGFAVNAKKTRVKRRNARQTVTGLVVNDKAGVGRDVIRRLRAILHRAKTEGLEKQNRQSVPHFRAWVEGMIAYISMSRPEAGEKLRLALAACQA